MVGLVQDALHSVKSKKLTTFILKLDLEKAYDKVSWSFLRLILLQVGLSFDVVKWIMSCVSSASFVVLINESPTTFFKSSHGIRQGCSLSAYLFLLIIEGFNRLLS